MEREAQELGGEEQSGGAMSLERAISAVRKRLKFVALMPLVAGTLVAAIVWAMPNRYDASSIIQIDPRQKAITNIEAVIPDIKGDAPSIESEVEIIRSRPVILQVINTLNLRSDPEFASPPLWSKVLAKIGIKSAKPEAYTRQPEKPRDQIADILKLDAPGHSNPERDEVAVAFLDRLKVMRVRNTLLIDIRFSASESVKAAKIANTIAEVYLKDQLDSKTRAASTASGLLEEKIDDMRKKVADAERKVEQWKSEHNVFDAEGQVLSEKQLARLMEQTVTARNLTAEARAKYEHVQKLARSGDGGAAIADVLQSNTVRQFKEQLATATRKSAELKTKYGPKHPDIIKVDAEVKEAQTQLAAEIERLVSNLKNEYEVAEGRELNLKQSLSQLKDQQTLSKDSSHELKDLEREALTSKQLFEALLTRYKQTSETQGFQLPDVRIVERADAPLFPASPKRKQLVLIAMAAGLILGAALAVLMELMAPGINRGEDIARVLEVDHLSSVPVTNGDGMTPPDPVKAVRLVVAEPATAFADAIRNARRALDMRRTSPNPRIVLVTSSMAGEGAEILASNLAHHYAVSGIRVLLIDADLRRQPLTRQLANARQTGLLEQVTGNRPLEAAILRDGLTGLYFLPAAGPNPSNIAVPEVLGSRAFADSLMRLRGRFDTIVMSAPPLLPVIDARILADYADQIVFVMTWQKTPKQLAKKALKTLGFNEKKVAGAILNEVSIDALREADGLPPVLIPRQPAFGSVHARGRAA
jgi:polysaccharide biosynthesis transport protein